MIVQKFIEPRSSSSGCKIILTSKVCCMKGGVRFLINRAHIILITGRMDDIWIGCEADRRLEVSKTGGVGEVSKD